MFDDILKNKDKMKDKKINLLKKDKDALTAEEVIFLMGMCFEDVYEEHTMKATSKDNYAGKLENLILDALIRADYTFQSILGGPNNRP
jgi:hypothetical protein